MASSATTGDPVHVPDRGWIVSRHRDVAAVLDDPTFLVPPAAAAAHGIAWLRASVSRFTNGADHARRRDAVEAMLGPLDPRALRADASARTEAVLGGAADATIDVMAALARRIPLAVLAQALAIDVNTATLLGAVTVAARAYPPGAAAELGPEADEAVEQLVILLGGRHETAVSRLTILVQTCDATAGLIGNSLSIALRQRQHAADIEGLLNETLRYNPPVRASRRVASEDSRIGEATIERGSAVLLDFDAANRDPEVFAAPERFQPNRAERHVTFGHGFRSCPGSDHALALAAGVVQAVLTRCEALSADVEYEPSPNLRVPAALEVAVR